MTAVAAMVAAGCSGDDASTGASTGATTADDQSDAPAGTGDAARDERAPSADPSTANAQPVRAFRAALTPFDDCSAFLDHVKAEASERVGPYGLNGNGWWYVDEMAAVDGTMVASDDAVARVEEPADEAASEPAMSDSDDSGDGSSGSYTNTNVQERGVDEPDIIKTDGERILVVRDDRLIHIDIADGTPRVTDEITIPKGWGHELFFLGDRALLFSNGATFLPEPVPLESATTDAEAEFSDRSEPMPDPYGWTPPAAVIIEVDLSDPNGLEVDSVLEVEGQYLSARRVDDMVRLAVSTTPQQLPWVAPQSPAGNERAEETNRAIIDESTIEDWTPGYQLTSGSRSTSGQLVDCSQLNRPDEFSGFDVVSVIDIDLTDGIADGFDPAKATGVLASGQTVYSSLDRFYVATTKWAHQDDLVDDTIAREWHDEYVTEIHAFAIAPGEPATYTASGAVDGTLLNQFSLDEHDGYLRVVTTDGSPWDESNLSESGLAVLAEEGDRLVQVGYVGGLGKGEQLYSARLLDDVGFAVTFRQIDPFYVIDLTDPTNPRVTGELKIPGFSTYLHPIDDDRVLGIGQDATEDGRVQGLKVSVFDVSDPANPRETAVWTMPGANSPAEYDHRAFQMWDRTAILPVENWNDDFHGAVLLDVDHSSGEGIVEVGRVSQVPIEAAPSSDCRTITGADEIPDDTDLFWMIEDAHAHVQLCGPDDDGGWGGHWCEPIPFDDIIHWGADPDELEAALVSIGAGDGDRVELCWPDHDVDHRVERSLVIDGILYTLTQQAIQTNDLGTFDVIATLPLR